MKSYKNAGKEWYQIHAEKFRHAEALDRKEVLWFAKKCLFFQHTKKGLVGVLVFGFWFFFAKMPSM